MNGETKKQITLQAAVGGQHIGQLYKKDLKGVTSLSQIQSEISTRFVSSWKKIRLPALRMEPTKSMQLLTTGWKTSLTKHPSLSERAFAAHQNMCPLNLSCTLESSGGTKA